MHQNHINDAGYVRFLEKLLLPVAKRLHAKAKGLDFGSGPQPVLAALFSQRQFEMSHYDPIYHDDKTLFEKTYDFVTASEVVEHFHKPSESWQRMANLLNADGLLGVMTKRVISRERFANWHYKNDKTHVSFYSDETMFWLAQKFGWDCELISSDVVLFTVNRDE
ncbi:class I SAM-dependent methyltransferase [Aestuariibacter salexigens]|uniref:class I SAM-dependent methyltransferase n=1 Tax=Aestuariibacter salexigens TaxID=226010 RepID=UPI00040EE89A|nr:class I SAM-dependent methyltransferase [Aestuariibacter salexigens]